MDGWGSRRKSQRGALLSSDLCDSERERKKAKNRGAQGPGFGDGTPKDLHEEQVGLFQGQRELWAIGDEFRACRA